MERSPSTAVLPALLLVAAALGALSGCRSLQVPAPPPAEAVLPALEADADPDEYLRHERAAPQPLELPQPPRYELHRIPATPTVIGKLDVPLTRRWRYIVVHHSYSDFGSAEQINEWHKQRGWLGVGYHFVIGNGEGSPDGAIEATFRWTRRPQLHGAHAGVRQYNQYGIGICLIGDFDRYYPTPKQMTSLVSLVSYLQERCHIPISNVMLHRHIKATGCPGKLFPYYRLISLLPH